MTTMLPTYLAESMRGQIPKLPFQFIRIAVKMPKTALSVLNLGEKYLCLGFISAPPHRIVAVAAVNRLLRRTFIESEFSFVFPSDSVSQLQFSCFYVFKFLFFSLDLLFSLLIGLMDLTCVSLL